MAIKRQLKTAVNSDFNVWDLIEKGVARYDGRCAISIIWFKNEADADQHGKSVRDCGRAYNGGWLHGFPCGREARRDYTDSDGIKWHAVTM